MPSIVKLKGSEISVTSANTVGDAKLVRIYASANAQVTLADASSNTIDTLTVPAGRVKYLEKSAYDVISSNMAILCTSISYNT